MPGWRALVAGFAVVLLLSGGCMRLIAAWQLEGRWRDITFKLLATLAPLPANDAVVVVGLDEEDLRQMAVPLALMHRPLGVFLEAMARSRAKAVGLDIALPEVSFDTLVPGLDAALVRGIVLARRAASLVAGLGVNRGGHAQPLNPVFATLLDRDSLAWLVVLPDGDGVVRRFDERLAQDGQRLPTLAGQLARADRVEVTDGLIHYAHGLAWKPVALRQVLAWHTAGDEAALRGTFEGRHVLLGSLMAFDDQHRTPLSLADRVDFAGSSHGVLLHAQQLRNLLEGRIVRLLPSGWVWAGLCLFVLPWWWPPGWGAALTGAVLIAMGWVAAAVALREGLAVPVAGWSLSLALAISLRWLLGVCLAARERARLRTNFSGMVSPAVLEEIVSGRLDTQSAGTRREVCVLFSDIRGFTTLSETMAPEEVTALLNRYFDGMARAVHEHGGTLDKFIGDGIMAVFGAPKLSTRVCDDALSAAASMLVALELFNADQRQRGGPVLRVGIGLHHGPAVVGYVGSPQRFEYSAIGDTVNTASRIESLTKDLGFPVLLSEDVASRVTSEMSRAALVPLGQHAVRGRSAVVLHGFNPAGSCIPAMGDAP